LHKFLQKEGIDLLDLSFAEDRAKGIRPDVERVLRRIQEDLELARPSFMEVVMPTTSSEHELQQIRAANRAKREARDRAAGGTFAVIDYTGSEAVDVTVVRQPAAEPKREAGSRSPGSRRVVFVDYTAAKPRAVRTPQPTRSGQREHTTRAGSRTARK